MCSDPVYPLDLKSVNVHKKICYKEGDIMEFDLIKIVDTIGENGPILTLLFTCTNLISQKIENPKSHQKNQKYKKTERNST